MHRYITKKKLFLYDYNVQFVYCVYTGSSKFVELLDTWFPATGPPPSAFLVDTSEEALLLPDWLKLRMIRSNILCLVDAGMR